MQINAVSTIITSVFSSSSSSLTDWTGMNATITVRNSGSKIFVSATSGVSNDTSNSFQYVSLFYNVNGGSYTQIAMGDAASSAQRCWMDGAWGLGTSYNVTLKPLTGVFFHNHGQPAGSVLNYKLQVIRTINGTSYYGRTADVSTGNTSAIPSTLNLVELPI